MFFSSKNSHPTETSAVISRDPANAVRTAASKRLAKRIPRAGFPLWAILGFAIFNFGGALLLAGWTCASASSAPIFAANHADGPIHSAPAISMAEQKSSARSEEPILSSRAKEAPTKRNNQFHRSITSHSALDFLASVMTLSFDAKGGSPGYFAPPAAPGGVSAVPEPSIWLSSIALIALVGGRCFRASWRRFQHRNSFKLARSRNQGPTRERTICA